MYADRVETSGKRSVKDRLYGNSFDDSTTRRRSITGKRQRQDDKWEHDLYHDNEPQVSNRVVGARDLRSKLQKKGLHQASQSGKGPHSGVRDLREKLSGTMNSQPVNSIPTKSISAAAKPARRSAVEAPEPETKRVADPPPRKKVQQKVETVDSFLRSLGLEKYSITFQAEEVDMTALIHMTDDDLKALGIPMLDLDSKVLDSLVYPTT